MSMNKKVEAKFVDPSSKALYVSYEKDVEYINKDGISLKLQILVPNKEGKTFPCIVYIQGSAWMEQDLHRNLPQLSLLAHKGYVVALVQYRHSGQAKFPAPIEDALDAYFYLKEHAEKYSIDPDKMILMGDSSGGHTAVMAGMNIENGSFDRLKRTDRCCAIIDLYGCVDPTLPDGFPSTSDHQKITSPEGMEMGFDLTKEPEKASKAVCRTYVDQTFAPILLVHGLADTTVANKQSVQLYNALIAKEKIAHLILIKKAEHGGAPFWSKKMIKTYDRFIQDCIDDKKKRQDRQ